MRSLQDQRSNLEIIKELSESGELKQLVKAGMFPAKLFMHLDIYYYVQARSGVKISDVALRFGVCRKTIYNVLNSFTV